MQIAKIGVDIGGTFTDIVFLDAAGRAETLKVLSTPADYAEAIVASVRDHFEKRGVSASATPLIAHATTVATNAVLEKKGARTALITTKGFRDVLEFRRLRIPVMYDLQYQKPPELVPRRDRHELNERTNADGSIARGVNAEEAQDIARRIIESGAEAVAVSLLNSYRNPRNEAEVLEAIRDLLPEGTYLCASSEILPEIREYERTSTTVVSAYVGPLVARYLGRLEARFAAIGLTPDILVMKSGGGVATVEEARRSPASIIESGPAAGVIAAASLARDLDLRAAISFDMGGTTAKAALIEDYSPAKTNEYEVGAGINISSRLVKGGGYPIRLSFIDVSEIGAGGGSIIHVDSEARSIGVGPESAGASPGPVCYGRGGDRATVTDALVVLGYINPDHLVGGALAIDRGKAVDAIARQVASPLGLSVERAALGALEIATATMVRAVKAVTTYQGRDPREHSLIAFGGNGPVFAAQLADALGMSHIIVPENPGVFTAVGLLDAAYELERVDSVYRPFAKFDPAQLSELAEKLKRKILAESKRDGLSFRTTFEMKYMGQAYELGIPVDDLAFDIAAIKARFHAEHRRVYGHAEPEHPLDLVSIRMTAAARADRSRDRQPGESRGGATDESLRDVLFSGFDAAVPTRIVRSRQGLHDAAGPLIVEEYDSTVIAPPGWLASTTAQGALELRKRAD